MEDEILIKQVLSGNKQAFGKFYDQTIGVVYKTVHFLLDEKVDVEDVVQETYIQVFKSLSKFNHGKPFKPWITGIAIKQIYAYRRKRWMLLRIVKKAEQYEQRNTLDPTIFEVTFNEEIVELVEVLPFKLKQVVILHYLNEYTQEEVATILDIPLGTVKSRINAALKKLRQSGHDHNPFIKGVSKVQ